MTKLSAPIGVFDSGMGGLTVLRALRAELPLESFVYLGDTARLPYGTKSPSTVQQYAIQMARVLVERGIKALVIACNTATTAALPHLQAMLPDIPVVGVVSPGALAAVAATQNQRILVLATETTIASNAYQRFIHEQIPDAAIRGRACSLLVALAEEGMTDNTLARVTLEHYLEDRQDEDTVLLGCTHFPVFKPLLAQLLPKNVALVDSGHATALVLRKTLLERGVLCGLEQGTNAEVMCNLTSNNPANTNHAPTIQYLVTDSMSRFQRIGEIFLGESLLTSSIELIDA